MLLIAALAVVGYHLVLRISWPQPWDPDEYFHVAIARALRHSGMPHRLEQTPFSTAGERYVDKEPLFHYALAPFADLSLQKATLWGVVLGLFLVVGSFAWVLWRVRAPRAWLFMLALLSVGTLFPQRLGMCRPHQAEIGFSLMLLGMLTTGTPLYALAIVSGLFGLTHTSGWIGIGYAVAWAVFDGFGRPQRIRRAAAVVSAVAAGWLAGQLLHPAFPDNFEQLWLVGVIVPLQAVGAGTSELPHLIGGELRPPDANLLLDQWPTFVVLAMLLGALMRDPRRRTRRALTVSAIAVAFIFAASLWWRRFFEVGPPLALLALAMTAAGSASSVAPPRWSARRTGVVCLAIAAAACWVTLRLNSLGFGRVAPPLEMAKWLGAHAPPGDRVFTVQWADSAPLMYAAPHLQSLVALDPTFFWRADPLSFRLFTDVIQARHPDPIAVIRGHFEARWIALPRHYVAEVVSRSLLGDPRSRLAFVDGYYIVIDTGPLPRAGMQ